MSTFLARLGRASYRHRGLVSVAWLAILGAVVALLVTLGGSFDDRFTIPGSESQDALDQLAELSPGAAGAGAQIVFVAPDGATVADPAVAGVIEQVVADARQAPQVESVASPFESQAISPDGRAALATVEYGVDRGELEDASVDALQETTAAAEDAGLEVAVGGDAFASTGPEVGPTELLGVGVAVLVLVLTFGSLLAAGMNLLTAFIGIGVGMGGLLLASNVFTLSSSAPTLALMIGLAVGIDYALFILSRHRTQLAAGMDPEESAARATGTAGSAVVFAGLTVIIALSGLSIVGIPFLAVMGFGAAGTVLVAVAVALTLLPALLGFAGSRLAPKPGSRAARREAADAAETTGAGGSMGARWTRLITRRPLLTVLAVLAGLLVLADPGAAAGARAPGQLQRRPRLPAAPGLRPDLGELRARPQRPAGRPRAGPRPRDGAAVRRSRSRSPSAARPTDTPGEFEGGLDDVAVAVPSVLPDGTTGLITVIPESGPQDEATADLVADLRDQRPDLEAETGAELAVTGQTAVAIDVSDRLGEALVPFAVVVVGLALVLLLLVFRSILVPIKAAVGFLLSVGASIGAVVAVFQWGWFGDVLGVPDDRPGHQLPAGDPDRRAVRPRHGLRGLPRLPHAGGVRPRRRTAGRRRHRCPARVPGGRRRRPDHVLGVRELRGHRRRRRQGDRGRPGRGHPGRRLHRPDDAGARRPGAAGPVGLVAAPLAGPDPARPGRRGRPVG